MDWIFDTSGFPRRWECGEWSAALGWTHIVEGTSIFVLYLLIAALVCSVGPRIGAHRMSVRSTAAFFVFCGGAHGIEALIFFTPIYRFQAAWNAVQFGTIIWAVWCWYFIERGRWRNPRQVVNREAEFEAITNASTTPFYVVDQEGECIFVTQSLADLVGRKQHEIVGHIAIDVLQPEGSTLLCKDGSRVKVDMTEMPVTMNRQAFGTRVEVAAKRTLAELAQDLRNQ